MQEKSEEKTPAMRWAENQWSRDLELLKEAQAIGRTQVGHTDLFSNEEFVKNLLRDARHFCDKHGIAFGDADKKAHQAYLEDIL